MIRDVAASLQMSLAAAGICLPILSCESEATLPVSYQASVTDSTLVTDFRTRWLEENAIKVRSLNPSDLDFSDLEPLRKGIGQSKIVMLGEQSHGDGTTFLAKTRLTKFLHQKMGFDVLAFESGLYDCYRAWHFFRNGENPLTAARRGIFDVWTESNEVQPLIDYLGEAATSNRPLELAGFDCQFSAGGSTTSSASTDFLISDLTDFLSRLHAPSLQKPYWSGFTAKLDSLIRHLFYFQKPSQSEAVAFSSRIEVLASELDSLVGLNPSTEGAFWIQLMRSIMTQATFTWNTYPQAYSPAGMFNLRDEQMGENLLWLSQNMFPTRKIIVWAATSHIMHNQHHIDTMEPRFSYSGVSTMGHVVWQELHHDVYVVGFTAYEGSWGLYNAQPRTISKPRKESLENLMRSAGLQNAFVDFRNLSTSGDWLKQKLISRPLGYGQMMADWTIILDGMMFTREMLPSTKANRK